MNDNHMVSHDGKVVSTSGSHVQVKIISQSACAHCFARSACTAADMQEKIIDAVSSVPLKEGDAVTVMMEEKLGWIALLYGFFLPFIVMISVLFLLYTLGSSEIKAALYGIGSLVPYYLVLYLFRKRIEKDFIFVIKTEKKNKIQMR